MAYIKKSDRIEVREVKGELVFVRGAEATTEIGIDDILQGQAMKQVEVSRGGEPLTSLLCRMHPGGHVTRYITTIPSELEAGFSGESDTLCSRWFKSGDGLLIQPAI